MMRRIEIMVPEGETFGSRILQFCQDTKDGNHYFTYDNFCIYADVEHDVVDAKILHCPQMYKAIKFDILEAFINAYKELMINERSIQREKEESGVEDYDTITFYEEEPEDYQQPCLTIKFDRDQYSIFEMKRKYDRRQICMDPEFQRNFVWNGRQMSELIESVIMGIPLPLIYLAENRSGNLVVVDGRQRLTTFVKFLNNEFRLNRLKILKMLNGYNFKDLEQSKEYSQFATNIEDFQLVIQIIKYPTPDKVRFDIFDRVNRGGTPLNKQEMRNALYQGPATRLLMELAETKEFREATGCSVSTKNMKDKYIILRAICFNLYRNKRFIARNGKTVEYRSDTEDFLGKGMEFLNDASDHERYEITEEFKLIMQNCFLVLGKDGFRIPGSSERRKPISMTLFETFYHLFWLAKTNFDDEKLKLCADLLLNDEDFLNSLQFSVDSKRQVDRRFDKVKNVYMEVFNGPESGNR